ncbi:MAG: hypothetical protein ACTHKB_15770 [Burkholderiaceae bacterium]
MGVAARRELRPAGAQAGGAAGRVHERGRGGVMMRRFIALCAVLVPLAAIAGPLPDPTATPGATNPAVTPATIKQTICVPGYSKRIRPAVRVTNGIKRRELRAGVYASPLPMRAFELDHLVPLSLGGAPADPRNLWPEPWAGRYGARKKDRLEVFLHRQVCAGRMPLRDAQHAIAVDWIGAYRRAFGALP